MSIKKRHKGRISRRDFIKNGAAFATTTLLPLGLSLGPLAAARKVFASSSSTNFDYYISPSGDDNNPGSLMQPWSITALNSKQSTYGGKRVGLLPGTYQYGTVGGVKTTLYSLYQNTTVGPALATQGGTAASPTYIASSDASGNYSPRTAIIDCSDPSTGDLPTAQATATLGQTADDVTNVSTYGYVTIDGLIIRNFTYAAILFSGNASFALIQGLTIQNCELYDGQNVVSNENPGAIWLSFGRGVTVTNCLIHDLSSSASGTSYNMQACGYIQFSSSGTSITNCTFYNCCAVSNKDGFQQMNVSYCYLGWGSFGSPYTQSVATTNIGGTVQNFLTGTGLVNNFHHNIVLGPVLGNGESSGQPNEGTVNMYNNTFYQPVISGASPLSAFDGDDGTATPTGTWNFYNNLVWAASGKYEDGDYAPGALTFQSATSKPSTVTLCDYNAYGTGITFGIDWSTGDFDWSLSKWQGYGFDTHSSTLSSSPFTGTPAEADSLSFAISGPATTAGVGGSACGALDGSGSVGCDFASVSSDAKTPMAPTLLKVS